MSKTYDRDHLPVSIEEMGLHRKKTPTPMVMVDGPFTVMTEEGPYHLPEGWRGFVAVGPGGWPYAISLESYHATYEPVGTMSGSAPMSTPSEAAGATQGHTPGPDEGRVRRYAEAVHFSRTFAPLCDADDDESCWPFARAAIAVADEEQAELRESVVLPALDRFTERAEAAEVEVERLTRECLDRDNTETDARERLRRAEAKLYDLIWDWPGAGIP